MNFHIISIFPEAIKSYFDTSILGRAKEKELIKVNIIDLKNFAEKAGKGDFNKVDDRPFGGGPGMVMKIEPIVKAILKIKSKILNPEKSKIIMFSPAGKQFTQKMAIDWAKKYDDIIMIAGRYEGVDARVKKVLKVEEISIGPYILTGGELPAAIVADTVSRQVPGVLGKSESLEEGRGLGYPLYTKPEIFEHNGKKYSVPKILLSGHHKKIEDWRKKKSKNFAK
ncbi:TPA: tRNA (guanosine(37)-N1)-methyltransferase TrmD [Patescibacteria group bacterium]|nr:MAG: tRNA (guanine-N(1)-)-methyltransferase [Parcubacteria group bacterium GW2011_GWF2_40_10]KKR47064.1 MAG: tRNA (guanine-N(1)-)-methyltransferase [Parcubacteria group bacterium GW2011_GWA2_40_143]KKR59743.1 MAG: tRNA (guanine-N(1)-)-methyltransferase [Parcubacteria group bacterium GW2011_GWC2_40_31]KKR77097.1 MAG: tRNA (guanine-N(1)-)-methyltransferase [Parcubacteria group bacterium GW2011_GWE2_40_8]KKR81726.1 MAG: tRNA (guanine-N(1)-)-methyltransferase [Parcubacteria group bacterium GW201